jgi:Trichohyalin-plectin-homology domain
MMAANKKQMELRAAAQAAAAADEERMKQAMLAKFAEDDRLEQMNAHKRRMRSLEHRKEV